MYIQMHIYTHTRTGDLRTLGFKQGHLPGHNTTWSPLLLLADEIGEGQNKMASEHKSCLTKEPICRAKHWTLGKQVNK